MRWVTANTAYRFKPPFQSKEPVQRDATADLRLQPNRTRPFPYDRAIAARRAPARAGTLQRPPRRDSIVNRQKPGRTPGSFYGVPVRSKRICFVLDRSGSMDAVDPRSKTKATRFEVAAAEVLKTTSKLKDAARVNVVFFDTNVSSWRMNLTRRVTIHTVAVGRNSKLLKQLAEYHGGTYVRR